MAYNVERRAVSSIILEKDIRPFLKARISPKFFRTHRAKTAYEWIKRYFDRFGKVPSKRLFRSHFADFPLLRSEETAEFFIEAIINKQTHKNIVEAMAEAGKHIADPREALRILERGVEKARLNNARVHDLKMSDDVEDMQRRYQERKNMDRIAGWSFGFKDLDETTDGMMNEQLSLIYGRSGFGKSWLARIFTTNACADGARILDITKENSSVEIANRFHALISQVNPYRLRTGQLDEREELRMKRFTSLIKQMGERYIVSTQDDTEGALGTSAVEQKIMEYKPDICLVDGLYLLEDEDVGDAEHKALRKIAYKLKALARRYKIHVIGVTQSNDEDQIAFSKAIEAACDMVFHIYSNDELAASKCKGIKLKKQREGPPIDFVSTWDFDTMEFQAVDMETQIDEIEPEVPV